MKPKSKKQPPKAPNFNDGVLCFVIRRPFRGKGRPRLIMHEAKAKDFGYGCFTTWLASSARKVRD